MRERRRIVRRKRQREVRTLRNKYRTERMRRMEESARKGDGDNLIRQLELSCRKKGIPLGGDRVTMKDEEGNVYMGQELKRKWRDTFESVGRTLEAMEGFDEELKRQIEDVVDDYAFNPPQENDEEMIDIEDGGGVKRISLNDQIRRWEVKWAIKRMKNGKATGEDGVVGEILKQGGEWMERSIWELCTIVFNEETMPIQWLRSVKVPVRKKGTGEMFQEYRGVTLLSVIGKVFGRVIERRIRTFAEDRGILTDCQFGFRSDRACRDSLLILTEVVARRGRKNIYAGFLDISKAYPSVWRKGLWKKLLEVGVKGRMWRVVRSLYSRCEVGVRVGGVVHDWYEEFVGLREGCVLSPLLFAIFINEMAIEMEKDGGCGVPIGETTVRCLMFADDIVIVDTNKEGLQRSLDVAWKYSRKWRFQYNFGKDKTSIMVWGKIRDGDEWKLGERTIDIVKNYKYLGMRMVTKGRWKLRREEMIGKARAQFWKAWGLGMGGGELSAAGAAGLMGGIGQTSARVWG